jgi:Ran GTPase-activating protein (RanGAP) involved in mRNA processing and transport
VVTSKFLTRLHTLRIYANHIGDSGIAALTGSELLRRVLHHNSSLDLRQNGIGPAGVRALADCGVLANAHSIDLSGNYLGNDGLATLAASPHLAKLSKLAIRRNQIADPGAIVLAQSELMSQLRFVDVAENRLTRRGVDALWNARRNFQTVLETVGNLVSYPEDPPERSISEFALSTEMESVETVEHRVPSILPKESSGECSS